MEQISEGAFKSFLREFDVSASSRSLNIPLGEGGGYWGLLPSFGGKGKSEHVYLDVHVVLVEVRIPHTT